MREQCNIFIRQEQAPLAKNEFVRLLDRPRCTVSAPAALDSTTAEQEKKESELIVQSSVSPAFAPGTDGTHALTIGELM